MTVVYPFADFLSALREKDDDLYAKLCMLMPGDFWREWQKVYPEDFPQGGMSAPARSSITPRKRPLSERLAFWDKRRNAFKRLS